MALPCFPLLALVSGLTVETGSPDALCPDVASAEEAIHARLGELEAEGANWRVLYTIGHTPDASSGDFVRLMLFDPTGVKRLTRDLPLAGESCTTMAQVIALVVDRFFRTMVAEREDEAAKATRLPAAPPEKTKDLGISAERLEQGETGQAFAISVQTGIVGLPPLPTLGLAFVRQWTSFSLASALTWVVLPVTVDLEQGGQAHSRSGHFRLLPSWDVSFGEARLALGPTLAASAEWGSTTGLAKSTVGFRGMLAVGGAAAFRIALAERSMFEVSAVMEAPFRPFGGQFMIDGQEVLAPPAVRGLVSLGFGPAWFW